MIKKYKYEYELCEEFIKNNEHDWDIYPESFGWDMYLFSKSTDIQVGIQAKLHCNIKLISQILLSSENCITNKPYETGPNYLCALVPKKDGDFLRICNKLNIILLSGKCCIERIIKLTRYTKIERIGYDKPILKLDTNAGVQSPKSLSKFRINALKLMVIYNKKGYITTKDIKKYNLNYQTMSMWFSCSQDKVGRLNKLVLDDSSKSPATNYEKELQEIEKIYYETGF